MSRLRRHRKKLVELHQKHKHNHALGSALILIAIAFLAIEREQSLPEDVDEKIAEAVQGVGNAAQDIGKEVAASEEFQSIQDTAKELQSDAVSAAVGVVFRANEECVALIREYEEVRLDAYHGPSGKVLIGYGHSKSARMGMRISLLDAERLLRQDLQMIEKDVTSRLQRPVTHNQFSAMVCLAYSIGTGAFSTSTVLKESNAGNSKAAADAFLLWNKYRTSTGMQTSPHLDERRHAERALYLKR